MPARRPTASSVLFIFAIVFALGVVMMVPRSAWGDVTYPPKPADRTFVVDAAELVSDEDERAIRGMAGTLLTERQIPIVVVTIESLRTYGAGDWPIERYAMNLFAEWGIGHADRNLGILVLVAKADRRARIELGNDWGWQYNEATKRIMDRQMIPRFRKERYSQGIAAGVEALVKMARGADPEAAVAEGGRAAPGVPTTRQESAPSTGLGGLVCIGIGILLLFMTIGSGMRGGRHGGGFGWGSFLLGGLLGGLGSTMYHAHRGGGFGSSGFGSGGGGGFGGGGFGGGFSGGGGASGGW